jgi:hypothetical protein
MAELGTGYARVPVSGSSATILENSHPLSSMGATMRRYCARVEAIPSASPRVVRVVFPVGRRPVLFSAQHVEKRAMGMNSQ